MQHRQRRGGVFVVEVIEKFSNEVDLIQIANRILVYSI